MENLKKKISAKNWWLIGIIGLMGQLSWAIENTTFATYALTYTGDSNVVTWMVALSATFTTIATFLSGTLSDRIGKRKQIISIGLILWGIATIVFGFADFIPKNEITILSIYVVSMDCVMSFCGSFGYSGAFMPWTTDISDESNRGTVAAITGACSIVANIIIQGLQGTIIDNFGFGPIFYSIGAIVLIMGIVSFFLIKDDESLKPSVTSKSLMGQVLQQFKFKELFANKDLFFVLLTLCVYTCGFNIYMSYSSSYLYYFFPDFAGIELSKSTGSLLLGGGMLVATALSFLFMKPTNNGKAPLVTLISIIGSVIGCVWLTFAKTPVTLFIALTIACLGYMVNLSALTAWFKNLCPVEIRGGLEGVRQIFYNMIPMIIGPIIASVIIKRLEITKVIDGVTVEVPNNYLFLAAAIVMALSFIPLIISIYQNKKKANNA